MARSQSQAQTVTAKPDAVTPEPTDVGALLCRDNSLPPRTTESTEGKANFGSFVATILADFKTEGA